MGAPYHQLMRDLWLKKQDKADVVGQEVEDMDHLVRRVISAIIAIKFAEIMQEIVEKKELNVPDSETMVDLL